VNLSVKNFEKQSTFGLVMDNIIVACFFDSQCRFIAVLSFIMLAHSFEIDNDMMVISVMCHCVFCLLAPKTLVVTLALLISLSLFLCDIWQQ